MKQTVGALLLENIGRDLLEEQGYADLTITFIDPDAAEATDEMNEASAAAATPAEKILENIPMVRILLQKQQEGAATK